MKRDADLPAYLRIGLWAALAWAIAYGSLMVVEKYFEVFG